MTSVSLSVSDCEITTGKAASFLMDMACRKSPIITRTLRMNGQKTIGEFLRYARAPLMNGFQSCEPLFRILHKNVCSLLGETIAGQVVADLEKTRMVLTANHHGVDYFAQSVQGTLLFSLMQSLLVSDCRSVCILACGNIPLNNLTYPRGLLIYQVNPLLLKVMPIKVPIYSDRLKRSVVSSVGPFDHGMIQGAKHLIQKLSLENHISKKLETCLQTILTQDYGCDSVLNSSSYSRQAFLVNRRLWKRMFAEPNSAPELVYLELERIVSELLEIDLLDEKSLIWAIMFDPALRESVLKELDGQRVCWNNADLAARVGADVSSKSVRKESGNAGTHFFWGIDDVLRRVPLCLEPKGRGNLFLRGRDDRGKLWEIPYTPQAVLKGLKEEKLLPSLLTCYLSVSLARGITCVGGYYQGVYLPPIQKGIIKALQQVTSYRNVAECVAGVDTRCYISGMQTVMTPCDDDMLIPAGPVEILAAGGILAEDLERIQNLSVAEAHLASLFDTVPDIAAREEKPSDWITSLAKDCHDLLGDRIVVKP